MFSTCMRADMGQFSRDVVGSLVGEYLYLAGRLTNRRWDLIMDLCGELKDTPALMTHSVQVNRRALYEPSSSMKGSDVE
jgi:hypothetical protein